MTSIEPRDLLMMEDIVEELKGVHVTDIQKFELDHDYILGTVFFLKNGILKILNHI